MIIFIVSSEMCFKNIWANCFHNLSVVSFNLVEGIISNQIYFHVHLMLEFNVYYLFVIHFRLYS